MVVVVVVVVETEVCSGVVGWSLCVVMANDGGVGTRRS